MSESDVAKVMRDVREYIQVQVNTGFDEPNVIIDSAVDVFSDELSEDIVRPSAERLTAELMAEHRKAQATWPVVTDCDRLDRAFAELESKGIVSRQNFSCCGNCGVAEIGDEIQAASDQGINVRGYTFYHMQDTEGAASGECLYLNYGSIREGEEAAVGIAREIVETLNHHGLQTRWDGKWTTRIRVLLDWKRRR